MKRALLLALYRSASCKLVNCRSCIDRLCECECHSRASVWTSIFLLLVLLLAAPVSAQRRPGQRIPDQPALVDRWVDRKEWHFNNPGQDGSTRYALDRGATLDCRDHNDVWRTTARRRPDGAFGFALPVAIADLGLDCRNPTIYLGPDGGPLKVGTFKPAGPGRRRASKPPNVPFIIVYGEELLAMPPVMTSAFEKGRDAVLTGIATEGPNQGKRIWIVVQAQGGFPLPGKCGAVLGNEFCVVWP